MLDLTTIVPRASTQHPHPLITYVHHCRLIPVKVVRRCSPIEPARHVSPVARGSCAKRKPRPKIETLSARWVACAANGLAGCGATFKKTLNVWVACGRSDPVVECELSSWIATEVLAPDHRQAERAVLAETSESSPPASGSTSTRTHAFPF